MLNISEFYGRSIVSEDTEFQEQIQDSIIDLQANCILGFVVHPGGWMGGTRILSWENIHLLTPHRIEAVSTSPIIHMDKVLRLKQLLEEKPVIIGAAAVTIKGSDIGRIVDIYFDEYTGRIEGYAVSRKVSALQPVDQWFIPATMPVRFQSGIAIIEAETLEAMHEHNAEARSSLAADANLQTRLEATLGLRIPNVLRSLDQFIIIAKGQIITAPILAVVQAHQQEHALLDVVGLSPQRG